MGIAYLSQADQVFDRRAMCFSLDSVDPRIASAAFAEYGVVALLPTVDNTAAQIAFEEMYRTRAGTRQVDDFNGVNFCIDDQLSSDILAVERHPAVLKVVSAILQDSGETPHQPAILNSKLIVKDKRFEGSVFLHQDSCYQMGRRKVTAFFLLSDLREGELARSTVRVLVGTHKFGHLGDAGEIDRDILEPDWPEFTMSLRRHSYVLMDPHCWHYSEAAQLGNLVRGIYTFTYASLGPICRRMPGASEPINSNPFTENRIFKRSRTSRLKELQRQVALLARERSEPPRHFRRLQTLRGWSHEQADAVFTGSAGAGGADGLRTPGRT